MAAKRPGRARIAGMARSYRSLYKLNFYIKQRIISCLMKARLLAISQRTPTTPSVQAPGACRTRRLRAIMKPLAARPCRRPESGATA